MKVEKVVNAPSPLVSSPRAVPVRRRRAPGAATRCGVRRGDQRAQGPALGDVYVVGFALQAYPEHTVLVLLLVDYGVEQGIEEHPHGGGEGGGGVDHFRLQLRQAGVPGPDAPCLRPAP